MFVLEIFALVSSDGGGSVYANRDRRIRSRVSCGSRECFPPG